jgi:hypothetical protein
MRFSEFIQLDEAPMMGGPPMSPMGGGMAGLPPPGGSPMGGGLGGPPSFPPPGGPGGMPPMGGGMPGQQQQPQQPQKIKTKDVWNLLEKLLSGQSIDDDSDKGTDDQAPQDNTNSMLRT